MSTITTHVLDTGLGHPAGGIEVTLAVRAEDRWRRLATAKTDADGRVGALLPHDSVLESATYRLRFAVESYFAAQERACFYPHVDVVFRITAPHEHHHLPLLLNAFGYTTYRGS